VLRRIAKRTGAKRAVYALLGLCLAYVLAAAFIAAGGLHDSLASSDVIAVPGKLASELAVTA
jgi:hypothetical protein